jgi:hypothetical protein
VLAATRTSARLARELAFQLVERDRHPLAVVAEGLPFGRERQAVGGAVDQPRAAGLLDAREAARYLAHGHVALARDGRQRAEFGHAREQVHVVELEIPHGAMVTTAGNGALHGLQHPFARRAVSGAGRFSYSGFTPKHVTERKLPCKPVPTALPTTPG